MDNGTVVDIDEPVPFSLFGGPITSTLMWGAVWIDETLADPKLDDEGRDVCGRLGIEAAVTVPLIKEARLVALISVQQARPRRWSHADVELVKELAERTWARLERAHAEEARQETEQLPAAIMRHAPIGIYVKDGAGRYRLVNTEMARLMKTSAEAAVGAHRRRVGGAFAGRTDHELGRQGGVPGFTHRERDAPA